MSQRGTLDAFFRPRPSSSETEPRRGRDWLDQLDGRAPQKRIRADCSGDASAGASSAPAATSGKQPLRFRLASSREAPHDNVDDDESIEDEEGGHPIASAGPSSTGASLLLQQKQRRRQSVHSAVLRREVCRSFASGAGCATARHAALPSDLGRTSRSQLMSCVSSLGACMRVLPVQILPSETGAQQVQQAHGSRICINPYRTCVAFDPTGELLASAGKDGVIAVHNFLDVTEAAERSRLKKMQQSAQLLTNDEEPPAPTAVDIQETACAMLSLKSGLKVSALKWCPGRKDTIFCTSNSVSKGVFFYDLATCTNEPTGILSSKTGGTGLCDFAFVGHGSEAAHQVIAGGDDGILRLWDDRKGHTDVRSYRGQQTDRISSVQSDGHLVFSASTRVSDRGGFVVIWDVRKPNQPLRRCKVTLDDTRRCCDMGCKVNKEKDVTDFAEHHHITDINPPVSPLQSILLPFDDRHVACHFGNGCVKMLDSLTGVVSCVAQPRSSAELPGDKEIDSHVSQRRICTVPGFSGSILAIPGFHGSPESPSLDWVRFRQPREAWKPAQEIREGEWTEGEWKGLPSQTLQQIPLPSSAVCIDFQPETHHSVVGCADNSVLLIGPLSPLPIDAEELIPAIPPVTAAPVFPGGDGLHQSRLEDHFENYDLEEDLEAN